VETGISYEKWERLKKEMRYDKSYEKMEKLLEKNSTNKLKS